MHIDKTTIHGFVKETLGEISQLEFPEHVHPCPHCGIPVRYQTIAREQDIKDFELMINSAQEVMDKYGITFNLLAEIKATCIANIAKKKAMDNEG